MTSFGLKKEKGKREEGGRKYGPDVKRGRGGHESIHKEEEKREGKGRILL